MSDKKWNQPKRKTNPYTRKKFNGKEFYLDGSPTKKKNAIARAKELRKYGYDARIIKKCKGNYDVWAKRSTRGS